jgi:chromosome segregation ATPase
VSAWELLQLVTALASAAAAGLLWAVRSRLPRQTAELRAKDLQIEALTREAEALRELTPIKIREYLVASHSQLRSYCQAIEAGYRGAKKEIEHCNGEITRLQEQGEWQAEEIGQLVARREALVETTRKMRPDLRELQHQCEFPEDFTIKLARMHPESIQELTRACLALARQLPLDQAERLPELSERVVQSLKYRLDPNTLFSSTLFARQDRDGEVWQRPDNGE